MKDYNCHTLKLIVGVMFQWELFIQQCNKLNTRIEMKCDVM